MIVKCAAYQQAVGRQKPFHRYGSFCIAGSMTGAKLLPGAESAFREGLNTVTRDAITDEE